MDTPDFAGRNRLSQAPVILRPYRHHHDAVKMAEVTMMITLTSDFPIASPKSE
jgi:hypothetical protein